MEVTIMESSLVILIVLLCISLYINIMQRRTLKDRQTKENSLIKRAYYNPITELPNLNNIKMLIDEQLIRTTRHKKKFLLAVIKIKNYHDVKMHSEEYANTFIKEASIRISDTLRKEDTIAHTTDNGFVILFNEYLTGDNYNLLLERLQNAFSSNVQINSSNKFDFKISVGTVTSSELYPDSESLINEATREALKN